MTDPDKRSEIDKLLAEVDRMTGDAPAAKREPAVPSAPEDDSFGALFADLGRRFRVAATTGAVAFGLVWVLFALLPFLRATSGAVGAAIAAFVAVLVLRRR